MIVLDLSRLLSRAGRGTPTGIDRVELAYAEHLIVTDPSAAFTATTGYAGLGLVPRHRAECFVAAIAAAWRGKPEAVGDERHVRHLGRIARLAALLGGERRLFATLRHSPSPPVYLLVSHHHLEKPAILARLKARSPARFVCLIHDLIPIEFPEYAKPGQAEHHLRRIETAAQFADALIVNSAVTARALQPHLDRASRAPPVLVAPFGVDLPAPPALAAPLLERPY